MVTRFWEPGNIQIQTKTGCFKSHQNVSPPELLILYLKSVSKINSLRDAILQSSTLLIMQPATDGASILIACCTGYNVKQLQVQTSS